MLQVCLPAFDLISASHHPRLIALNLLPMLQAGAQLLRALAALWAVPEDVVQQYVALHKPAVQAGAADLAVGRATLPLLDAAAGRQALAVAGGKVGCGWHLWSAAFTGRKFAKGVH